MVELMLQRRSSWPWSSRRRYRSRSISRQRPSWALLLRVALVVFAVWLLWANVEAEALMRGVGIQDLPLASLGLARSAVALFPFDPRLRVVRDWWAVKATEVKER